MLENAESELAQAQVLVVKEVALPLTLQRFPTGRLAGLARGERAASASLLSQLLTSISTATCINR